ncbi:hypothetical protein LTR15_002155 [Elasticomyces elasticus]|nr:hypothetical protein LTR15_002155 [Elasticomyces elasticus]
MAPNEKPEAELIKGMLDTTLPLLLTEIACLRSLAIKKGTSPEVLEKADLPSAIAKRNAERLGYGEQYAEAIAKAARNTASI